MNFASFAAFETPVEVFPAEFGDDKSKDQYNKDVDDIQTKIGSLATNAPDEKVVDKVDVVKAIQADPKAKATKDQRDAIGFLNQALPQDHWEKAEVEKALQSFKGQDFSMGAGEAQVIDLEKQQTIGFSQMQTVSADPEDPNQMGEYPEGAATAFNQIFRALALLRKEWYNFQR